MTELLEAAFIDEVVSGTLGAALERAGFGRVRGRTWVRSGPPPVRHMVMLNALKGAA